MLLALAFVGCGDDGAAPADLASSYGCYLSSAPGCCPNQDPTSGLPPEGLACSPEGSTCAPGTTDVLCKCGAAGWHCYGTLFIRDMARPQD